MTQDDVPTYTVGEANRLGISRIIREAEEKGAVLLTRYGRPAIYMVGYTEEGAELMRRMAESIRTGEDAPPRIRAAFDALREAQVMMAEAFEDFIETKLQEEREEQTEQQQEEQGEQ